MSGKQYIIEVIINLPGCFRLKAKKGEISNGKIIGGQYAGQDAFEVISTLEYQKSLDNGNGLQ